MPSKDAGLADRLAKIATELRGAFTEAERVTMAEAIAALSGRGLQDRNGIPGKKKPAG